MPKTKHTKKNQKLCLWKKTLRKILQITQLFYVFVVHVFNKKCLSIFLLSCLKLYWSLYINWRRPETRRLCCILFTAFKNFYLKKNSFSNVYCWLIIKLCVFVFIHKTRMCWCFKCSYYHLIHYQRFLHTRIFICLYGQIWICLTNSMFYHFFIIKIHLCGTICIFFYCI